MTDSNEVTTNKINGVLIRVETLEKEYEATLKQYQEAFNNYINILQATTNNPCETYTDNSIGISQLCYDKIWSAQGCTTAAQNMATSKNINNANLSSLMLSELVHDSYLWATIDDTIHRKGCYGDSTSINPPSSEILPTMLNFTELAGRTWWGKGALKESAVDSAAACESMCASDLSCSGATFNSVKRYCWTRTGDSQITVGESSDYALIPSQKASLTILKSLNERLLRLNKEIGIYLRQITPQVNQQQTLNVQKQKQLDEYYQTLLDQKITMEQQLQDYYSVEQNNENQSLYTNQQNKMYTLWALITCFIVLITLKCIFGGNFMSLNIFCWISIIIILLTLTLQLGTPAGFTLWFIFLLTIIWHTY